PMLAQPSSCASACSSTVLPDQLVPAMNAMFTGPSIRPAATASMPGLSPCADPPDRHGPMPPPTSQPNGLWGSGKQQMNIGCRRFGYELAIALSTSSFAALRAGQIAATTPKPAAST